MSRQSTQETPPEAARCKHPPLCQFGTCGTMLCLRCGMFYSTCHHAVHGAEEDVLVECSFCETLVWVPVSLADEPAFCPDHTGDPSEPGNPGNPRSSYDVVEDDEPDDDPDSDPSEPGHPGNPRSSYDLAPEDGETPPVTFIRMMLSVATAAFQQHRVKDLEVGPLSAFVDVTTLVQQARDLPIEQLVQALQAVEARHTAGRMLVDAVLRELDADSDWAALLDAAGAVAETAEAARWLIQRARYVDGESEQPESRFARDAIAALEAAVLEHGYKDVSSGDIATCVDLDPFVVAAAELPVRHLADALYAVRDEHPCGDLFAARLVGLLADRLAESVQAALKTTTDPRDRALVHWLAAGAPAWWDLPASEQRKQ